MKNNFSPGKLTSAFYREYARDKEQPAIETLLESPPL